jgi:dynein heavy chain
MCYLEYFLRDELLDEMEMFPYRDAEGGNNSGGSFKAPTPTVYEKYLEHIDVAMVGDSPLAFGLHPNAEIGFRTDQCNSMLATIVSLQPNLTDSGGGEQSVQHAADAILNDILDAYSEVKFDMIDIRSNMDTPGPFQNVFLQECETMNLLVVQMMKTLEELNLGFQGEMTMSKDMETLMTELALNVVPIIWRQKPYDFPSLRPLSSWLSNLRSRIDQLSDWTLNPLEIPRVTWISGLFNPQRFLTGVLQTAAQLQMLELDKLMISTLVLKREVEDIETSARDGAYIHGLHLEGARFDVQAGQLEPCKPKEMSFQMPVLQVKAVPASSAGGSNTFYCPVYKTQQRGPTFVFTANLRSKQPAAKWVLAGACMVMEVV